VSLVGETALFATVFDGRTNLGLVRYYATETAQRLEAMMTDMMNRGPQAPAAATQLSSDFRSVRDRALDKLF
jgi:hypothetical protein